MNEFFVSFPVFVFVTVILFGLGAAATGNSVASVWKPRRHLLFYCLLLSLANRFLVFALFGEPLLSHVALGASFLIYLFMAVAAFSWRRFRMIRRQYPWVVGDSVPKLSD